MQKKLKIMTILGTRPEIIRLSRVMALLDQYVKHVIVHTGQNYDYELNEIFFKEFKVRNPDYFLGIDCSSLGSIYGNILISVEKILLNERPDAVLILGDTNSSIAGLIAKRMKIPIYHMEAGNRCFDLNVPEEINRKIIDHISDFNLVYTEHGRRNLLAEGIHPRRIYLTGSPMKEVLDFHKDRISKSMILQKLKLNKDEFFVVSIHREENVDHKTHLAALMGSVNALCDKYDLPVIVSTHPRTRKRIISFKRLKIHKKVMLLKPFGFIDYLKLQSNAFCVISDSGTISEESAILSFPAITVRNAMERPEAMDTGNIILTGLNQAAILNAVEYVAREKGALASYKIPFEYKINNTSARVLKLILGTARLSHLWDGIHIE